MAFKLAPSTDKSSEAETGGLPEGQGKNGLQCWRHLPAVAPKQTVVCES
jgi:hypothetical protein